MSRSAKSGSRSKKKKRQTKKKDGTNRDAHPSIHPPIHPPIHPSHPHTLACTSFLHPTHHHTHHLLSDISLEGKTGEEVPRSCRCIFFFSFYVLSGDYYNIALADIYLLHLLVLLRFYIIITSSPFICLYFFFFSLSLFYFFFVVARVESVNIDFAPIRYPPIHIHTLFVHFSVRQPLPFFFFFHALRSLLHAYHSLLVWPLYQQPLSFLCEHSTQPIAHHPHFLASSSDCSVKTHKVELKDAQYI